MRYYFWMMPVLFIAFAVGCGPAPVPAQAIKGKVTFDGTAIPDGVIYFDNNDKNLPSYNTSIKDGAYQTNMVKGMYKVRVTAFRMGPYPDGTVGINGEKEGLIPYIPPQFNDQSTLKAEVTGPKDINFDLKSE